LKARLYDELPGHSGMVLALCNLFNFVAALIPLVLGILAESYGLGSTLWLLILGPLSIFLGVKRA
jgi:MFS transporter, FSR family, fosmidomycin resistance protein